MPPVHIIALSAVLLVIGIILWTALLTYNPADPAWRHNNGNEVSNALGGIGAWYSDLSFSLIGKMSHLVPLTFVVFAVHLWREKSFDRELFSWRLFMLLTAVLSGCVLWAKHDLDAINTVAQTGGGAVGAWLAIGLEKSVKSISIIMAFSGVIFAISLSLLFNFPWGRLADAIGLGIMALLANIFAGFKRQKPVKVADEAASEVENTALQDKIKHLNETAGQRKAAEHHEPEVKQPQFTIDRYEPEITPPAGSQTEIYEKPEAAVAASNVRENHWADQAARADAETTDIPLDLKFRRPTESFTPPESDEKSEPNFFDFSNFNRQKKTAPTPSINATKPAVEPVSQATLQPQPVVKATPADSLAETFTPSPAMQFSETKHREAVDIDVPDFSHNAKSTIAPEPAIEAPIPEAKPKRPKPLETAMPPEVNEKSQTLAQPPVREKTVPPIAQPNTSQPVTISGQEDGIVDETVLAPVNAVEAEPQAPRTAPATVAATTATAAATTATIGSAYNNHAELADTKQLEANRPYELPSIDLLDTPPPQKNAYTEDVLAEMAGVLEQTLNQFNIKATVMHVSPGPVITRFELELAPGIQAKKITNLSQDLARALAVSRVRVEEVIPGSSYVGLEVPNKQRQTVYFYDIVRSKAFQDSTSPLTISLGSDTSGKPQVVDLMKMPHALVAGTTGSGKSVCINVMLLSMLYKASPKDLRLILVDPKMLEMSMYEDIPHLLTPVITDMNEAENALAWAVGEMERRYQLMAALKVRKIDAFNAHIDQAIAKGEPIKDPLWQPDEQVGYTHHPTLERLPFIVIVIDELADMMMVVGKQVEQLIARLTQKARAAGIHVVLATQRPSTDVLTGLIKANVPTRIAFQVSSGTDSRVIIDGVGAEKLLGHGDMLYVPPGASHPQRFHGAFVGDAETDRITHYLRSTADPQYIDGITGKQDPESLGAFGAAEAASSKDDADPLYEEAVEFVLQSGKASISSVQRQLRIGYNRAARMIEDMQEQGIVSAPNNGVRKVLGR